MSRAPGTKRIVRAALVAAALFAAVAPARAHVVYGATTVRQLALESDLVVRARIAEPAVARAPADPARREPVVVAEILEVLVGQRAEPEVRFVQHGHGAPLYERGEEVLVFLQRIERSRELAATGLAATVAFVSVQEAGDRFALHDGNREAFTAAVRDYAALAAIPAAERLAALRRITLRLLGSPEPQLAASALRDLVIAGDVPVVTRDDLPALEPLLASAATPIGVRIGLLAELERRGLVDAPPRWAELVRTTAGADRIAAVRAAGAHPSEAVARALTPLLAGDDPALVAAAAVAMGAPGDESAVAPLAALLEAKDPRVRGAAIRGLGRIATGGARATLAQAAASHPDAGTRRRAGAELILLDRAVAAAPPAKGPSGVRPASAPRR